LQRKFSRVVNYIASVRFPAPSRARLVGERSPSAKLPTDPSYQRFDLALERVLDEASGVSARCFPYFGRVGRQRLANG